MSAIEEFFNLLETTEVMKQTLKILREEPAHLLGDICQQYEVTSQSVPDYRLHLVGYMTETSLSALLSAKLIKRYSGDRLCLYVYEPTAEGLEQYAKLKANGFYGKSE